jgi:hypothetical protein
MSLRHPPSQEAGSAKIGGFAAWFSSQAAGRGMSFPWPVVEVAFPTPLAAKLAISVQLARPLGNLPEPDRLFIDALLAETLDRDAVAARVREHFRTRGRADAR